MSWQLRIILVIVCILVCAFTLRKIKKAQIQIEDSLFWIIISFALVILSIFPGIAEMLSKILGIESTVNCVFLVMIFILFIKIFMLSIKISQLEEKIKNLVQRLAIQRNEDEKQKAVLFRDQSIDDDKKGV